MIDYRFCIERIVELILLLCVSIELKVNYVVGCKREDFLALCCESFVCLIESCTELIDKVSLRANLLRQKVSPATLRVNHFVVG